MNDIDLMISWLGILVVSIGLILAILRVRAWWRDRTGDPLDPTLWMRGK